MGLPCILEGVGELGSVRRGGGLEMDMEMLVCCSVPHFHYVHTAAQPATTFSLTSSNTLDQIRERYTERVRGIF